MHLFFDLDHHYLTEEQRMLRAMLRRFVDEEVKPNADRWEVAGHVPREVYHKLGDLGVLGSSYAHELGGSDMGLMGTLVVAEEAARSTYGGFAGSVTLHTDMSRYLGVHGSDYLKSKYMPGIISGRTIVSTCVTEPGAGSDVAGLKTRAVREGDSYVVSGSKLFITSGIHADLYLVAARTDPHAAGSRGVSMFAIEKGTPGFSISAPLNKTGWRCSDTAQLYFDGVRVSTRNLIGEENQAFQYIMNGFARERFSVGGICVGHGESALELTLDWVKNRKAFGGTLWDQQHVRLEMARMVSELNAAKALLYQAAWQASQVSHREAAHLAAMVKAHVPVVVNKILYQCVQFHGGMGYMTETPVERISRDVRLMAIGGGATEVMLQEVAKRI